MTDLMRVGRDQRRNLVEEQVDADLFFLRQHTAYADQLGEELFYVESFNDVWLLACLLQFRKG